MTGPSDAIAERTALHDFTARDAHLLVQDEIIAEAKEWKYKELYIYQTIGKLAYNLCLVGEENTAVGLAETLLRQTEADEAGALLTWSSLAENGAKIADGKLRDAMGLTYDDDGSTLLSDKVDLSDGATFNRLLSLYKFGDKSILPYLHQMVGCLEGDALVYGSRLAIKLYDAGDESAYDLIKTSAEKARAYAFASVEDEEAINAEDASDLSQIMKAVSGALTPARSHTERVYAQTDIALKYFAEKLLLAGDLKRADEVQSLMLSGFDNAWVNARRFEYGYDPDGEYLRSATDYVAIYGDDQGSHILEITDSLVRGGDAEMIELYSEIYNPSVRPEDIEASTAASMLVALHHSGDTRAHDRLVWLLQGSEDAWKLVSSLDDMGFKEEAIAIARKEFARNPSYRTGLSLLNLCYDNDAMEAVQNGVSEYDYDAINVVNTRARHLGKLATHIIELEQDNR